MSNVWIVRLPLWSEHKLYIIIPTAYEFGAVILNCAIESSWGRSCSEFQKWGTALAPMVWSPKWGAVRREAQTSTGRGLSMKSRIFNWTHWVMGHQWIWMIRGLLWMIVGAQLCTIWSWLRSFGGWDQREWHYNISKGDVSRAWTRTCVENK